MPRVLLLLRHVCRPQVWQECGVPRAAPLQAAPEQQRGLCCLQVTACAAGVAAGAEADCCLAAPQLTRLLLHLRPLFVPSPQHPLLWPLLLLVLHCRLQRPLQLLLHSRLQRPMQLQLHCRL